MQPKWRSSDLTVDNEGFVLAMRFGTNSEFTFGSPYWTNDELVDEANMSATKNADGKFRPFLSTVAGQIKGCFLKQDSTEIQGCVTYTLPRPKTLKDLFAERGSTQVIPVIHTVFGTLLPHLTLRAPVGRVEGAGLLAQAYQLEHVLRKHVFDRAATVDKIAAHWDDAGEGGAPWARVGPKGLWWLIV